MSILLLVLLVVVTLAYCSIGGFLAGLFADDAMDVVCILFGWPAMGMLWAVGIVIGYCIEAGVKLRERKP